MESPRKSYNNVVTPGKVEHIVQPQSKSSSSRILAILIGVPGIILGALLGIGLGVLLQQTKASPEVVSWIALPGELFIRALKCLVAPLVFCSIVTGMSDMLAIGKASSIGWRTALAYVFTTFIASIQGLLWVLAFRGLFSKNPSPKEEVQKIFSFDCGMNSTLFHNMTTQSVSCVPNHTFNKSDGGAYFIANDLNSVFKLNENTLAQLTMSESFQMTFKQMVPSNITASFADAALLSIVMFSLPFGIAVAMLPKRKQVVISFFRELNLIFMSLIKGVIVLTSVCLISLLANSLSDKENLKQLFSDIGIYTSCVVVGILGHVYVVMPIFLFVVTRTNVIRFYTAIMPAQIFALSCASSMATLPVSMKCIDSTTDVSTALSRFVLSLGATINMDGAAIYFPAAIVFMAETSDMGDKIGAVQLFLIAIVSTLGAVGTAPVPNAGIVMIMTVWSSVLPGVPVPGSISYVMAADFLLDRFSTMANVSGDCVITRVIASLVGLDALEEERASFAAIDNEEYLADKEELRHELEVDRQSRTSEVVGVTNVQV